MKWNKNAYKSRIVVLAEKPGESIEEKMRKVTQNNEPIDNVAPLVYTERKDGVLPQYDVRTDRFELARQAKDKYFTARMDKIGNEQKAIAEAAAQAAAAKQEQVAEA